MVKEFGLDRRQGKAMLAAAYLLRQQFENGKHLEDILGKTEGRVIDDKD